MKALKEKRLSLRSILRRGLVILSLFALVFVSCGESGGGEPPEYTGPGETTPTNPPKRAISIKIDSQPTAMSWQGQAPVLDGTKVTVLWSDGQLQTIEAKDFAENGISASPPYCDLPGVPGGTSTTLPDAGHFYLTHTTSNVQSDELKIPGVVWLDKIVPVGKGPKLYSDVPPFGKAGLQTGGLEGFELTLSYTYAKATDADKMLPYKNPNTLTVGTDAAKYESHNETIKMSSVYPPINLSNAKSKKVVVGIGYSMFGPNDLSKTNKNTIAASTVTPPDGNLNPVSAEITLDSYVQVFGIEYKAGSGNDKFYILDDEVKYAKGGMDGDKAHDNSYFVKQLVEKSDLMFTIYYDNEEQRDIGWTEFLYNVSYAYAKKGVALDPNNIFWGATQTQLDQLDPGDPYTNTILFYNDDDYTWTFQMEYVPKEFIDSDKAYTARFDVPAPVYEFQSQITVARKPGAVNNIWKPISKGYDAITAGSFPTANPTGALFAAMNPPQTYQSAEINDLYNAIKDRWVLTGVYQRYGDTKTPPIPILSGYLYQGEASGGLNWRNPANAYQGTISLDRNLELWGQLTGYGGGSAVIANRNYPLPLRFRGETLVDEDTILIDVYYQQWPSSPSNK